MIYPENLEDKIGFKDISRWLKGHCQSTLGTEWIDKQLCFMTDPAEIRKALDEAREFQLFEEECDEDFENEFYDVREPLARVRPERTYLSELDLFNLKRSVQTVADYVKAFTRGDDEREDWSDEQEEDATQDSGQDAGAAASAASAPVYRYPSLGRMAEPVGTFPEIVRHIDRVLNQYGKVKDTASPDLLSLRHQIEVTTRSISHSLRTIVSEAQTAGYIDRDVSPTLRDGRLVIPVAPALKRKIKGIIHDESATGKTVFIEPEAVVDANNKIRTLRAAEAREVIRILQELTAEIRPHIPEILLALQFLSHIDYLLAVSDFATSFHATFPTVDDAPRLDWAQARHPVLEQSLTQHGGKIVPLDVTLRQGQRILLISGPNAGGKSVCLKTVGLLQYMLQCGMPVTAAESSKPGVFSDIMIDIGDEQSMENDLSTYSSHLLSMRRMMKHGGGKSLLLIDEFGSGTEPQIGGALAEAVLNHFCQNRSYGIITTHFQNLKHFAENNHSVVNGAMLYDREKMSPLFMLQVGTPGSSFAIEIARKMGIPRDVIDYAIRIVGKDYVLSDRYVQDIVRDRMYWQSKRSGITQREQQLETAISRYEREMTDFQQERKRILAEAKLEAKKVLEEANARVENTIRAIREAQAEKEKTKEIRADLTDFQAELERNTDEEDRIARKIAKIQRRQERKASGEANTKQRSQAGQEAAAAHLRGLIGGLQAGKQANSKAGTILRKGAYVRMKGQNSVGKIESISGKNAKVLFGMMFTQVPLNRLEQAEAPKPDNKLGAVATFLSKDTRDAMYEKKLHFHPEIDIRGMRVDEALQAISYFIDDSIQLEQARVRILHGTGTGALRELVRNYLRTVPGVRTYHDEHVQFGGAGITVVEMN